MNNLNETEKKEKKTNIFLIRESSSKNLKDVEDISKWMRYNFSESERRYFAGMIDGDGYVGVRVPKNRKHLKLSFVLELRHDHAGLFSGKKYAAINKGRIIRCQS